MKLVRGDLQLRVMDDVLTERDRQNSKWGEQNHSVEWMSILGEEFGEACQEFNAVHFGGKSPEHLRAELVQVAAVAVAIIECLDRKKVYLDSLGSSEAGM